MTNIQAINLLNGLEQSLDDYCELNDEGKTAFRMAITALEVFGNSEQLPSVQPEPCEDVVSKEAVSSWLKQYGQDVLHGKYKFSLMYIWKNLMDLPSVTPKQRWIPYGKRKPDKPTISGLYIVSGIWKSGSAFVCPCAYNGELGRFETPYNSYIVAWMSLPEPYKAESEEGAEQE